MIPPPPKIDGPLLQWKIFDWKIKALGHKLCVKTSKRMHISPDEQHRLLAASRLFTFSATCGPLKGHTYHVCLKCTTYRILRDIDPCYIKGCRGFWWVRFRHLSKYIEGEMFFQIGSHFKGQLISKCPFDKFLL